VDDRVGSVEVLAHSADVGEVVLDDLCAELAQRGGSLLVADEGDDIVATLPQNASHGAPDEPGPAGQDDPHQPVPAIG
jgi:hypothetical protein